MFLHWLCKVLSGRSSTSWRFGTNDRWIECCNIFHWHCFGSAWGSSSASKNVLSPAQGKDPATIVWWIERNQFIVRALLQTMGNLWVQHFFWLSLHYVIPMLISVCAENPILVLGIFSWIIAGLAFGIQNLIIITDPAELWASPTSEARLEKDYFDSRFGPFYRTNQIFIKPTNTQHVCDKIWMKQKFRFI